MAAAAVAAQALRAASSGRVEYCEAVICSRQSDAASRNANMVKATSSSSKSSDGCLLSSAGTRCRAALATLAMRAES